MHHPEIIRIGPESKFELRRRLFLRSKIWGEAHSRSGRCGHTRILSGRSRHGHAGTATGMATRPISTAEIKYLLEKEVDLEWTFLSPSLYLRPGARTGKISVGNRCASSRQRWIEPNFYRGLCGRTDRRIGESRHIQKAVYGRILTASTTIVAARKLD